jgi:hypothetical protein
LVTVKLTRDGEASSMEGVCEAAARGIEWFVDLTKLEKFDIIAIEAPIPEAALRKRSKRTGSWATAMKYALVGSLGACAIMRQSKLRMGHIGSVRKFLLGEGNGNISGERAKPAVMRVCRALGWSPKNNDEGDAAALWLWACGEAAPRLTPRLDPISLGINPLDPSAKVLGRAA